jgi:hypothetical protein
MMISEVCHEVKNWFDYARIFGRFKIEEGKLRFLDNSASIPSDLGLQDGQYYRIVESVFNDGVWQYHKPKEENAEEETETPETSEEPEEIEELRDEEFLGGVWLMAVPRDFLKKVDEIIAWEKKYGGVDSFAQSPLSSESFEGYSRSKASGGSGSGGSTAITWKNNFASDLDKWRKI